MASDGQEPAPNPLNLIGPGVDRREVAVIAICSVILFLDLIALVYTYINRTYLPLKTKNLPLMYWTYLSGIFWFVGDVYSYFKIARKTSWITCVVTTGWLRLSLGGYLWMGLFQYRLHQYIAIFIWKRRLTGIYFWVPMGYVVLFPLIYAVISVSLPQPMGHIYIPEISTCTMSKGLFYFTISFAICQLLVFGYVIFMARKIHTCFNEYRELLVCFLAGITPLISGIATFWIPLTVERLFIFGTLNTVLPIFNAQVYFAVLLARPIYHCVVNRDEYLVYFLNRMKEHRLIREYQMANNDIDGNGRTSDSEYYTTEHRRTSAHQYYRPDFLNRVGRRENRESVMSTAETL